MDSTDYFAAIAEGDADRLRAALEAAPALIDARNASGRTALHDAIEFGHWSIVELLLERGAEVDICAAAILGRVDRVRELLDADPSLADDRSTGLSPLCWASFGNRTEAARLLIERGARIDDGELLCAASVGHVEVGRLLIEHGVDPDLAFGEAGTVAIHAAAAMRYTEDSRRFVEMLLDHGADVNRAGADGRTALDHAETGESRQAADRSGRQRCYRELAALLRRRGARRGSPRAD